MTRLDISDDEFRSRAAPGEGRFRIDQKTHTKMFIQVRSEGRPGRGRLRTQDLACLGEE